ncbi:MAG: hypothetical protein IPH13_04300 [Planctomycetes bacterium]|nr:hypothetical protein [Planctomycetota bacterium]MCC7172622.1 hypothetical protein [Planctomycetota bacterium]
MREFSNDTAIDWRFSEFVRWCEFGLIDGVVRCVLHRGTGPVREGLLAYSLNRLLEQDTEGLLRQQRGIEQERSLGAEGSRGDVHAIDLEIREEVEEPRRVEAQNVVEQEFGDGVGRARGF